MRVGISGNSGVRMKTQLRTHYNNQNNNVCKMYFAMNSKWGNTDWTKWSVPSACMIRNLVIIYHDYQHWYQEGGTDTDHWCSMLFSDLDKILSQTRTWYFFKSDLFTLVLHVFTTNNIVTTVRYVFTVPLLNLLWCTMIWRLYFLLLACLSSLSHMKTR